MDQAFDILLSLQRGTPQHEKWVDACLNGSWAALVGERLSAVCRPVYLGNAILKIEVVDDAWIDTVRSMRIELQKKLSDATCGEVREFRIVKGSSVR